MAGVSPLMPANYLDVNGGNECTVVRSSPSQATVPELIIYRLLIGDPCKLRSRNSKETLVIQ